MKKLYSLFSILFIGMMTVLTLSSCNDDNRIGYTLEGTWEGRMYSSCTVDGKTYKVTKTIIEFCGDPCSVRRGTGYWRDYYSNASWDYWSSSIDWEVRNGNIYVHFFKGGGNIVIHDFRLNDDRFTGWFYDNEDTVCDFQLYHTYSPNWGNSWGWGYYNTNPYLTRSAGTDTDSVSVLDVPSDEAPREIFK